VITNPQTLAQVAGRLPGGVTVEYRRRVKAQAKESAFKRLAGA
jgi:hypothetical protein